MQPVFVEYVLFDNRWIIGYGLASQVLGKVVHTN